MSGIQFAEGVKVKSVFCYGIPLVDTEWENTGENGDFEIIDAIYDIAFSGEFIEWADKKNIIVEHWKWEDCDQILLAHKELFAETTGNDEWDVCSVGKREKLELKVCLKKLCQMVKDKIGVEVKYKKEPVFFLHLYYD